MSEDIPFYGQTALEFMKLSDRAAGNAAALQDEIKVAQSEVDNLVTRQMRYFQDKERYAQAAKDVQAFISNKIGGSANE